MAHNAVPSRIVFHIRVLKLHEEAKGRGLYNTALTLARMAETLFWCIPDNDEAYNEMAPLKYDEYKKLKIMMGTSVKPPKTSRT